jgi:hypothetical protein
VASEPIVEAAPAFLETLDGLAEPAVFPDEEALARFQPPELWAAEADLETATVEAALEPPPPAEVEPTETDLPDVRIGELPEPPTDLAGSPVAEATAAEPAAIEVTEPVASSDAEASATVYEVPLPPLAPHPIEAAAEEMAAAAELATAESKAPAQPGPVEAPAIEPVADLDSVDIEALWERVSARDPATEVEEPPRLNDAAIVEEPAAKPHAPDSLEAVEALMGELKRALKSRRKEAPKAEQFKGFDSPPGRF